jgi:hypothetical protein
VTQQELKSVLAAICLFLAAEAGARGPWRASAENTRGWQFMTPEERIEHQSRVRGFSTLEECRAYQREHHKLMEDRARARGEAVPSGRRDICGHLKPAAGEDRHGQN